jgi:guanylate kinase
MSQLDARPLLFVVSGPSGAGKGLALESITRSGSVRRVPTYTTREPRPDEKDGVHYNFVTRGQFLKLHEAGVIFEYTRTYSDSYYGSPSSLLGADEALPMAVELDPMGFVRVRATSSRRVIGIFVTTDTEHELRRRLVARGQVKDSERRLRVRVSQETWAWVYDYVLVNKHRNEFIEQLDTVVQSELIRAYGAQHIVRLRQHLDPTLQGELDPTLQGENGF